MSLEKAQFDTTIIEFSKLREEAVNRIDRIQTLAEEPGKHLLIDADMNISILPEFKPRALEIWQEIENLRHQNKNVEAYMDFSLEVLKKYNIPIIPIKEGETTPHEANLEQVIIRKNTELHSRISHLKQDFADEKINAATFEKTKKSYEMENQARISQVRAAKEELQKFIDSIRD